MEDDNFPNARSAYLFDAGDDRSQVQIADRTACEATELQMGQCAGGVGDRYRFAGDRGEPQFRESVADADTSR
jgi:hypothetical protein